MFAPKSFFFSLKTNPGLKCCINIGRPMSTSKYVSFPTHIEPDFWSWNFPFNWTSLLPSCFWWPEKSSSQHKVWKVFVNFESDDSAESKNDAVDIDTICIYHILWNTNMPNLQITVDEKRGNFPFRKIQMNQLGRESIWKVVVKYLSQVWRQWVVIVEDSRSWLWTI